MGYILETHVAIAECAICYFRPDNIGGEVDLQNRQVVDNWRRDGDDDEQHCGDEQQKCADVVEEDADTHVDVCVCVCVVN